MSTFWNDKHDGTTRTTGHTPAEILAGLKAKAPGQSGMMTMSLRNGVMSKAWQPWATIEATLHDSELETVHRIQRS